ncbi:MAG: J domain-containing protein [Kofleriaceae bacterium]
MSGLDWDAVLQLAGTLDRHTYYQLLDLPRDADGEAVRDAYRTKTQALHPDRHAAAVAGAPDRRCALVSLQARINEAYKVLSNPRSRTEYDRGIGAGHVRAHARAGTSPAVVADPATPQAKRYFDLAIAAERARNQADAVMYIGFALQLEPQSEVLRAAHARLVPPKPGASPPAPSAPAAAPTPPPAPPSGRAATVGLEPSAPGAPIELRCKTWRQFLGLHARGLARGELQLRSSSAPPPLGTRVALSIVMPNGDDLALEVEVVEVITAEPRSLRFRFEVGDELGRHLAALAAIAAVSGEA